MHLFFATCTHRSFSFFLLFIHIIYIKKIESASLAHFCRKKGRGVVLCRFKDWKPAVYFLFVLPLFKPKCFKKVHLLPLPHLPPFLGGGGGARSPKKCRPFKSSGVRCRSPFLFVPLRGRDALGSAAPVVLYTVCGDRLTWGDFGA